jgi:tetratricopeptide (TPR) repeat protein
MAKNRSITFVAVALLCITSGTLCAQKKGSGGGGGAAMEHANKAVKLSQEGALDAAIAEFTLAIEANPKDPRFYMDRGGVFLTQRKFQEAANDFGKSVELAPKDHRGYSLRGAALNELNQPDPAFADLNKALELKPNDPQTLERRGYVFFKQNRFEEALADYNNAVQQNPNSTLGLSRRADAYFKTNRLQEAKADLEKVIQLRPEDFSAQDRLMQVNARLAPPPAAGPVVAAPTAPPQPQPTPVPKLLSRKNIFIGLGALIGLIIVGAVVGRMMVTRSTD